MDSQLKKLIEETEAFYTPKKKANRNMKLMPSKQKLSAATALKANKYYQKEQLEKNQSFFSFWWLPRTYSLMGVIMVAFLVFNHFFFIGKVNGNSMLPTFSFSEYIVLRKNIDSLARFDVIAFNPPEPVKGEYLKRIIGLPGDHIEIKGNQLFINGKRQNEDYLINKEQADFTLEQLNGVKRVPMNKVFVLGDNRQHSKDSRSFGFVDINEINGKVEIVL